MLLDFEGHVVLSDFGLSKMFLPHEKHKAHSYCGTLRYMALEMVETCADGYDMAVDWWSLGIITYELLTGWSPFQRQRKSEIEEEISSQIITEQPYLPDYLSFDAANFISKLLVKDPRKHLGGGEDDAEELRRHPLTYLINSPRRFLLTYEYLLLYLQNVTRYSGDIHTYCHQFFVVNKFQPTAESCSNPADLLSCQNSIDSLKMALSEAKRVQMRSDMEKRRLESDLRAVIIKIKSLEAGLIEETVYRRDLTDAIKRMKSLEAELIEENCVRKR
jgi:serine/threonine protein kinase